MMARKQPVKKGCSGAANMQETRGGRGKAGDDFRRCTQMINQAPGTSRMRFAVAKKQKKGPACSRLLKRGEGMGSPVAEYQGQMFHKAGVL